MAWLDERIWCHPKVTDLSDRAFRVWINSIAYSSGMQTLGLLSVQQQRLLGSSPRIRKELFAAGLWDEAGDGVLIHDWEHYNADRDAKRAADRMRKRLQRDRERDNGRDIGREFRVLKSEE